MSERSIWLKIAEPAAAVALMAGTVACGAEAPTHDDKPSLAETIDISPTNTPADEPTTTLPSPSPSWSFNNEPQIVGPTTEPSPTLTPSPTVTPEKPQPTTAQQKWEAETAAALAGAKEYLDGWYTKNPGKKMAIISDIDNVALASKYAPGMPVKATLELLQYAKQKYSAAIVFNTARRASSQKDAEYVRTLKQLQAAGYSVDALCMNGPNSTADQSKQNCRQAVHDHGFFAVIQIGNHDHDFGGPDESKYIRLPSQSGGVALN